MFFDILPPTLLLTFCVVAAPFTALTTALTALADERINIASESLLDRIQVEDFINDY